MRIQLYIHDHISEDSLIRWDNYFKDIDDKDFEGKSAYDIVLMGVSQLVAEKTNRGVEITVQHGKNSLDFNAKLYERCKLINFGNLTVSGTYIFTDAFTHFQKHLVQYVAHYVGSL